jgi:Ohr subfamily peroxiredoxin
MEAIYTASATSTGDGRGGHVRSADGIIDTDMAFPKEMGGPGGAVPNPELLFASGWAACFHSAILGHARSRKLRLQDTAVTVDAGLVKNESGLFQLQVAIEAEIPGVDTNTAQELLEAAHQTCPYSNATRGNIEVKLSLA